MVSIISIITESIILRYFVELKKPLILIWEKKNILFLPENKYNILEDRYLLAAFVLNTE